MSYDQKWCLNMETFLERNSNHLAPDLTGTKKPYLPGALMSSHVIEFSRLLRILWWNSFLRVSRVS